MNRDRPVALMVGIEAAGVLDAATVRLALLLMDERAGRHVAMAHGLPWPIRLR